MVNLEIEIISRETIKPSSPTPPHLSILELSLLDQLSPFYYIPIIFYYPIRDGQKNQNQISSLLKHSLSETLSRFYPLAGRIKNHVSINCNDEGVLFSEAKVNCQLSELLIKPKIDILNQFLPCPQYCTVPINEAVQVAIQLNIFTCGGIAISMCFFHKVVDGATMSAFLKCWAAIASTSYDKAVCPDHKVASQLFSPSQSARDDMFLLEQNWLIKEGKGIRRRFVFDAEAITALISSVKNNPSRVEVVSGFIWKHVVMAASRVVVFEPSVLAFAVNIRRRMMPMLSENSTGNMTWQAMAHHMASPNEVTELQDLVISLREAVAKIDNEFIRSLQGEERFQVVQKFREMVERMYSQVKPEIYMVSSWCKFGFNEVDFGWGKPIWVSNTGEDVSPVFANHITLMDTVMGDGIEAWVLLDEKLMATLESDSEFLAFASLNPTIAIPNAY